MNPRPTTPDDWLTLADAMCAGTISPAERDRLEALLRSDEAARLFYINYLDMHAQLQWELRGAPVTAPAALPARRTGRSRWFALAAGVLALAGLTLGLLWRPAPTVEESPPLANLTAVSGARWSGAEPGVVQNPGVLELTQGLAEITFAAGAVLLLEAPARLEVTAANRAILHYGRAVARVPAQAPDFTMDTPRARVAERGAEFGVGVGAAGDTWVQVYEGAALTEWKDDAGEPQRVQAGEAVGVEAASAARPQARTFAPEMFVRALPQRRSNDPPGGALFNRSRFDTVHVVPAPAAIAIDGELADWDASGAFRSACVEPYGADYFVEGMMMYDAEKLYIAAHVGDPHPMRSRREAATDPGWVWAGGSVIVRLSTSRSLAWPINAAAKALGSKAFPDAGLRPQDRSDRIAHLIMWHHQPTGTARLQRAFGMDSHGRSDDSVGWQGVFRRDPNGRGYVLEYAIPWALLHAADDPPRAGDVFAASWNVHWSDEDGRTSRGHLVEVAYPPAGPYLFINSATWGRALYHAKGKLPPGAVQPHLPGSLPR